MVPLLVRGPLVGFDGEEGGEGEGAECWETAVERRRAIEGRDERGRREGVVEEEEEVGRDVIAREVGRPHRIARRGGGGMGL